MHCVDPNCVSVCPVSALKKDPKTALSITTKMCAPAAVTAWSPCPYNVPKYDYNNPFGALHKCELCNQKGVERLDKGGLPGCVEVCPAGAVIFGTREELMAEAKKTSGAEAWQRIPLSASDAEIWRHLPAYGAEILSASVRRERGRRYSGSGTDGCAL
ncbi:4Fe-4S dicluster domain-containing protein [Escherichia coli]